MDGITIIQTIPQYEYVCGWNWWAIIPLIAAVLSGVAGIWMLYDNDIDIAVFCFTCMATSAILTCALCSVTHQEFSHNRYQVLIDDSVSMVEFANHYTIIEQQGSSFIIEEQIHTDNNLVN